MAEAPKLSDQPLSDEAREVQIRFYGRQVEHWCEVQTRLAFRSTFGVITPAARLANYRGANVARRNARHALDLQNRLIAGRRPEYVAQLERERGLT